MVSKVNTANIDHLNIKSDHKPIYLDIDLPKNKRGQGYWKFSNYLLTDTYFCEQLNNLIDQKWTETANIEDIHTI